MVYLAIWCAVALAGLMVWWVRRQALMSSELEKKLAEQGARADKLAGYVQRALEDTYVLSTVMAERGHIDPDSIEQGRERLLKKVQKTEPKPEPQPREPQSNRTLH
jgi:hypothetical protein